jgi:hypothetical protein
MIEDDAIILSADGEFAIVSADGLWLISATVLVSEGSLLPTVPILCPVDLLFIGTRSRSDTIRTSGMAGRSDTIRTIGTATRRRCGRY